MEETIAVKDPPKRRFATMFSLYAFDHEGFEGIWRAIAVHDLTTSEPMWTIKLEIIWDGCKFPLGTIKKLPEAVIDLCGRKIDYKALLGEPNPNRNLIP